jgi:hypothetical protein
LLPIATPPPASTLSQGEHGHARQADRSDGLSHAHDLTAGFERSAPKLAKPSVLIVATTELVLKQIASTLSRHASQSGRVNLLYLFDGEQIHAFDRNRSAVQIKRNPL